MFLIKFLIIFLLNCVIITTNLEINTTSSVNTTIPVSTSSPVNTTSPDTTTVPVIATGNVKHHGDFPMGIPNEHCDDGKHFLDMDWNGNPVNYTCAENTTIPVNNMTKPLKECDNVTNDYSPDHYCMGDPITYDHILPTHGHHRPLWARFGEYKFIPPQRWSHNIEHGSIIMLYHPCVDKDELDKLRNIVTGCLRKHIITAYNLMPMNQPFALLGWGCRLLFNSVDPITVKTFIKEHAIKGPEARASRDGQYDLALLKSANIVNGSDFKDSKLCPSG